MTEFEQTVGIQYLRALHLNDSRAPRGSKRDLHANIGTGFLGLRAFHNVMNEPRFEHLPMILETPIDRPASEVNAATVGKQENGSDSESSKPKKKAASKKISPNATVADPGVWAREIKLLESLIGMDPEGADFKKLEGDLAEQGREMRQKYQEQYERKLEVEEKQKNKDKDKKQKTLVDMMVPSKSRASSKKQNDSE